MAAGHRLTARAGAAALAAGGTAVDAAVAAAFVAAVAEATLTGPAAGGFLLLRTPQGEATLLDFFVAVPGLGPRGRALDPADLESFAVPFAGADQIFHIGPASVAVPGMVHGLAEAASRFGRMTLRELVAPAVRIARQGVVVTPEVEYLYTLLATMLSAQTACAAIHAPRGRPPRAGERLVFPELADSLEEIGEQGPAALAGGTIGRELVAHLEQEGGLVTDEDLRAYRVIERRPLELRFRSHALLSNPPPSSGGILIGAALEELQRSPRASDLVGRHRRMVAAGVRANALRGELVSRKPAGSTTHISVVDSEGGMASLSSSNGSASGVVVPGTGILLNNMLGEEDLNPGGFGLLPPGVRMTSMMAPTLVLRDGAPELALGSAGSNRLRSAILQTLVGIVDDGLDLDEAVRRPRVHPEGDGVDVEPGLPETVLTALEGDGHRLRRWGERSLFFGGVAVAGYDRNGLGGAGDPRRGGAAAGVTASGEVVDL